MYHVNVFLAMCLIFGTVSVTLQYRRKIHFMLLQDASVQAWVVAADMGLGHKRAVFPFSEIAHKGIIIANSESFAPADELMLWNRQKRIYESLSRIKSFPVFGEFLFGIMDKLQSIRPAYPREDLSRATLQTKLVAHFIGKGMGKKLVETEIGRASCRERV